MKIPQILTRIALTIFSLVLLCLVGQAQSTGNGAWYSEPAGPAIEACAGGDSVSFALNGKDLKKALMEQAPPAVWLLWPPHAAKNSSVAKAELPVKVRDILHRFWKAAVAYQYYDQLEPRRSPQAHVDRDMAYVGLHKKLRSELRLEQINSPTGLRLISKREADSLMMFITLASIDLVKQAKTSRTDLRTVS